MDFDLSRILHIVLDLLGDIARQLKRQIIIDDFRAHNDANFAAGLQRITLLNAVKGAGDLFQLLHAADI